MAFQPAIGKRGSVRLKFSKSMQKLRSWSLGFFPSKFQKITSHEREDEKKNEVDAARGFFSLMDWFWNFISTNCFLKKPIVLEGLVFSTGQ